MGYISISLETLSDKVIFVLLVLAAVLVVCLGAVCTANHLNYQAQRHAEITVAFEHVHQMLTTALQRLTAVADQIDLGSCCHAVLVPAPQQRELLSYINPRNWITNPYVVLCVCPVTLQAATSNGATRYAISLKKGWAMKFEAAFRGAAQVVNVASNPAAALDALLRQPEGPRSVLDAMVEEHAGAHNIAATTRFYPTFAQAVARGELVNLGNLTSDQIKTALLISRLLILRIKEQDPRLERSGLRRVQALDGTVAHVREEAIHTFFHRGAGALNLRDA